MATQRPPKPTTKPRAGYEWSYNATTKKWVQKKNATAATAKPTYADYGYVQAFLDQRPGIKRLLDRAIKQGWTGARLEGEIKNTKWWKDRTDAQRKWDLLSAEQPAERDQQVSAKEQEVTTLASRLGVTLAKGDANKYALAMLRDGDSPDEVRLRMAQAFKMPVDNVATPKVNEGAMVGEAAIAVDDIRELAADYGVLVSDANMLTWTRSILGGQRTVEELEDTLREQAKALYPPLATYLDQGQTVKGFTAPYLDIAARELGLTAESMDLTDTKWTGMVEGGQVLSADGWVQKIRSDSRYAWNESVTAKREAMSLVSTLGSIFGGA